VAALHETNHGRTGQETSGGHGGCLHRLCSGVQGLQLTGDSFSRRDDRLVSHDKRVYLLGVT
jgi:hypothetical protein